MGKIIIEDGRVYKGNGKLIGKLYVKQQGFHNNEDCMIKDNHVLTVVGIRSKVKTPLFEKIGNGDVYTVKKNITKTVFKLGHAIKNPIDINDPQFGLELAVKRAVSNVKILSTNSCSLLNDERCMKIVEDEYQYVKELYDI
jgi:hypothetical protein